MGTVTGVRLGMGGGAMSVVVGEVVMGQSRQALLARKEFGFYSRRNGMSWRYKARTVAICYSFGWRVPNPPSYLEFTILCNSDCVMSPYGSQRGQVHSLSPAAKTQAVTQAG